MPLSSLSSLIARMKIYTLIYINWTFARCIHGQSVQPCGSCGTRPLSSFHPQGSCEQYDLPSYSYGTRFPSCAHPQCNLWQYGPPFCSCSTQHACLSQPRLTILAVSGDVAELGAVETLHVLIFTSFLATSLITAGPVLPAFLIIISLTPFASLSAVLPLSPLRALPPLRSVGVSRPLPLGLLTLSGEVASLAAIEASVGASSGFPFCIEARLLWGHSLAKWPSPPQLKHPPFLSLIPFNKLILPIKKFPNIKRTLSPLQQSSICNYHQTITSFSP